MLAASMGYIRKLGVLRLPLRFAAAIALEGRISWLDERGYPDFKPPAKKSDGSPSVTNRIMGG